MSKQKRCINKDCRFRHTCNTFGDIYIKPKDTNKPSVKDTNVEYVKYELWNKGDKYEDCFHYSFMRDPPIINTSRRRNNWLAEYPRVIIEQLSGFCEELKS